MRDESRAFRLKHLNYKVYLDMHGALYFGHHLPEMCGSSLVVRRAVNASG